MIISQTPFRLSFLGGGTDLPSFFEQEEGMVLSTTLDKYMYISVKDRFEPNFRVSYSRTEIVDSIDKIEHQIVRAVLKKHARDRTGLEIVSMSDIPAGTGLGSSSAFTVGLLHALKAHLGHFPGPEELAQEASEIELVDLGEPIGKQDQYASAYGGLQTLTFLPGGAVKIERLNCSSETIRDLQDSVMMFYTGIQRSASAIFHEQNAKTPEKRKELRAMRDLALELKVILERGRSLKEFGRVLHEGWQLKRTMASGVSTPQIDEWYARGLSAGAWGGKISGAGGGGFLMFICPVERQKEVKKALSELRYVPIRFESLGSRVVFVGDS